VLFYLLYLLFRLVYSLGLKLVVPLQIVNLFLQIHQVDFQLPPFHLFSMRRIFNGVNFSFYSFILGKSLVSFVFQLLNLILLKFHFFLKSGAHFLLAINFLPKLFKLIGHADNLNIQILGTFGVVVRRILNFKLHLFQFLLLLK
jgi:hypothetical protein